MTRLSEYLPWYAFEAPGTVALWGGGYQKTYRFRGTDVTSASEDERLDLAERLNSAVRTLGPRWTWHVEGQNVEVSGYPKADWPTTASRLLDASRAALCTGTGKQYEFRHFLTLTQTAHSRALAIAKHLVTAGNGMSERDQRRDEFRHACDGLAKHLRGVVSTDELDDDDTATYLHSTVSTRHHRVRAADHEILSETLGDQTFTRGLGLARLGESYMAVMTLGGFPRESHPQILAALERLPFEFRWVTRWITLDRRHAKAMMSAREVKALGSMDYWQDLALAKLQGKDKEQPVRQDREQRELAREAGEAMTRLSTRDFGSMTTVFTVCDRSARRCLEKRTELESLLQQQHGLVVRRETVEQVKPWRMSLPGNTESGRRTVPLNSRNLADFLPTSSVWHGMECDRGLAKATGVRRPWMYTADPVPMRINTDVPGGAAHAIVFGATGQAAKSTLANHLAMQFFGWPNAQVVSFSVGRSELGPVILSGGVVHSVGSAVSPGFQPLAFVDDPTAAGSALEWLQVCLDVVGHRATPRHVDDLAAALKLLGDREQRLRTMSELTRDLGSRCPELALALKPFTRAGLYGHIFDGDDAEAVKRHRWTMFDLSLLLKMSRQAIVPACAHMLQLVESWFDGSPMLVLLDEIQEWCGHAQLQVFVERGLNTQRKNRVRFLLLTPTPSNLERYDSLLKLVRSSCATVIYGRDASAHKIADSYRAMGLSDVEIEHVRSCDFGSYMLKNQHGTRKFALRAGEDDIALALTGMSAPEELALLAELGQRCSTPDEALWELLTIKGLADKARRLLGCESESTGLADAAQ